MESSYTRMPEPAESASAGAVLASMIDAAAYRYYWASEGLTEEQGDFRPSPDSMNLHQLGSHIEDLARRVRATLLAEDVQPKADSGLISSRAAALSQLEEASAAAKAMDAAALDAVRIPRGKSGDSYPVWNLIHGPIADFLTHVGQVNSWRRIAGDPAPAARVFHGLPPEDRGADEQSRARR